MLAKLQNCSREDRHCQEAQKKAGLSWYALKPAWRDFFEDPVYQSEYKVIFFLNPEGQNKYNSGWFTVEELLQWIKGKGPVIRNC